MGEACGTCRNCIEAENFIAAIGVGDADGGAAAAIGVAGDAFMRDVEMIAVAVEQTPGRVGRRMRLRIGIATIVGEFGHPSRPFTLSNGGRAAFVMMPPACHGDSFIVNREQCSIY